MRLRPPFLAFLLLSLVSPLLAARPYASQQDTPPAQDDERAAAREERIRVLVEGFLGNARAAMERGEMETARTQLSHAFELDPGNQTVRDLLQQVSLQLGESAGSVAEIRRGAEDLARVRRTQARLEVEDKLTQSDRQRAAGDLDGAIRSLEDALLVLRWNPYLAGATETGLTEQSLKERIEALRRERAASERQLNEQRQRLALEEQAEREREEQERAHNQVKTFLLKANDAFFNERYKEAETFCDQVLELVPDHPEAVELRTIAMEARHAAMDRDYNAQYRYHWREIFDELEYDDLPSSELVEFPSREEWDRIHKRGPTQFAVETEEMAPEDLKIQNILDTQLVPMNFSETSLEDAISFFNITTGANFIIDPAVRDMAADATLDLRLAPMPARKALDLLMEFSGIEIAYRVEDGVVYIVTKDQAAGGQTLEFYDVRDLTRTVSSFPSRDFNLTPSGSFADEEPEEIEPAPIVVDADNLAELIRSNIDPDSWSDPSNTLNFVSGALVVRQTPAIHKKIEKLLSDLRHNAGTLVNVETRFLKLEDRFLEDIGVDFRGLDGQNGSSQTATVPNAPLDDFGLPGAGGVGNEGAPAGIGTGNDAGAFFQEGGDMDLRGRLENLYDLALGDEEFDGSGGFALEFTYLDDTQVEAILRAVQKSSMAEIVKAQNLTVFNGQRANIVNQDHITYLQDFEVEIAQGAVIADPVLGVITDGTILDVRPVVSADRRFVTMEVRPTVADLVQPIRLFRTSLAIGNEVEIMLPEMQIQRVRTTVTIPDGATLMLGGMKSIVETQLDSGMPFLSDIPVVSFFFSSKGTEHSKSRLLILVRARIVIPEESEPRVNQ